MTDAASKEAQAASAKKFVRASTWLAVAGVLCMILGCLGAYLAAKVAEVGGASTFALIGGLGLGMGLLVAAAVVGQIGRAMQGRVI